MALVCNQMMGELFLILLFKLYVITISQYTEREVKLDHFVNVDDLVFGILLMMKKKNYKWTHQFRFNPSEISIKQLAEEIF